jgi:predicted ribosome quality control (RQC) complex YloA/Tae2 family protein
MYDALTIAAISDELAASVARGRIQRLQHVDELTVAFEIYARGQRNWLTLSADSQDGRVIFRPERPSVDSDIVSPLLLLLRKYARGARILAVSQPRFERILHITIAQAQYEDADDGETDVELEIHDIVIELMGRHSNIMLVDEAGRIRDAIKRVTPSMSRVRPILPGNQYIPPPPQEKLDPLLVGPSDVLTAASDDNRRLDRWLVSTFLGVSPLIATELLYRCSLERDELPPAHLSVSQCEEILRRLVEILEPLETGSWSPHLYRHDGGATFAAIPLRHLAERDGVETIAFSSVLEAAAVARDDGVPHRTVGDRHAPRRARLVQEIENARERLQRRLEGLERQQENHANPDELRTKGEMIYAYLWMIEPGMTEIETPDGLSIALNPELSANDNAQDYFERYRKAKSAADEIPKRLRQTQRRMDYVDQLLVSAAQADSYDEIESIRLEWQEFTSKTPGIGMANKPGGSKPSSSARRPNRYELESGAMIWVGKTGRQNDAVTFDIGRQDDLWLHAREMPGAHVILRPSPGREPTEAEIQTAAQLAAHFSTGRDSARVPVDVTERRHVRKIRGSGPGMVTYRNEYTIDVEPQAIDELELTASGK